MNFDITKVANVITYMIDKKIALLDDRKVLLLLFLIDHKHNEQFGKKIFNDTYIKEKRKPKNEIMHELFEIIKNEEILDEEDERVYLIEEILYYVDMDITTKENFSSIKFIKIQEEEFDSSLFSKDELRTINIILDKYTDTTVRNLSNETFSIQKTRDTKENEIIL